MKTVLIVSKAEKPLELLSDLMKEEGYISASAASTAEEAESLFSRNQFDMIVINTPLGDKLGKNLAVLAAKSTNAGVILLLLKEDADSCAERLGHHGVIVVEKPINVRLFKQAVRIWEVAKRRTAGLENENVELKTKVEELKTVNRAKFVLMETLAMSEAQAHRYLEKQAMDMRQTKLKAAQQVLRTYENF